MNQVQSLEILRAPHISEKSTLVVGQYTFEVSSDATKSKIRSAIESQFGVTVESVRVCNVKGKATRFRQVRGRRRNWKKAYITLASGEEIDIASGSKNFTRGTRVDKKRVKSG
ncbi:50S ribosomal protein L23 [Coxiella endosymbiont of Amblyomma sculptum]|uniref:50S ribosomal protein L23 n=1 Tax=Coxiella endosymbiont of Amblyomma sculptum TaxID=2487929 RepID=UPI00132F134F|nr:50S ribosomal protein L23 [Coxiella endosymbiont of Amblyomma sculptum]QHG92440.1 50S ribosomal protein L23 [Coxiella endosymbiont of Amblyomma sculptum]